jgi:glycosyltransferase involved in cell wall biosynthesis
VTGYVPDVLPYLDAADVVVCPLRIGGGVKLKTIEALRRGKAIVSTHVGAQGLDRAARRALVIADDPREFADAVANLLARRDHRLRREAQAARVAAPLPTWDGAAAALGSIYDELLDRAAVRERAARPEFKPEALGVAAGSSV